MDAGVTIHTVSVGAEADKDLLRAIAYAGGGIHVHVPGGVTIEQMNAQMLRAFGRIAAKVPLAKLDVND